MELLIISIKKRKVPVREHKRIVPKGTTQVREHTRNLTQASIKQAKPLLKKQIKHFDKAVDKLKDSNRDARESLEEIQESEENYARSGLMQITDKKEYEQAKDQIKDIQDLSAEVQAESAEILRIRKQELEQMESVERILNKQDDLIKDLDKLAEKARKAKPDELRKLQNKSNEIGFSIQMQNERKKFLEAKGVDTNAINDNLKTLENKKLIALKEIEKLF